MSRGPQTFRQRDVTKAVKGVVAAGMPVTGVQVRKDGSIIVLIGKSVENPAPAEPNEWLTDDQN